MQQVSSSRFAGMFISDHSILTCCLSSSAHSSQICHQLRSGPKGDMNFEEISEVTDIVHFLCLSKVESD